MGLCIAVAGDFVVGRLGWLRSKFWGNVTCVLMHGALLLFSVCCCLPLEISMCCFRSTCAAVNQSVCCSWTLCAALDLHVLL